MSSGVDPTLTNIRDQTITCKIPNQDFETVEDLIQSYGFRIGSYLAKGALAKVYEAEHIETGLKLAVKVIIMTDTEKKLVSKQMKGIQYELYTLQRTKHPNLIKMVANFIVEKKKEMTLYLFLQFAINGPLTKRLQQIPPFDEDQCRLWFAQMLSAMNFMHNKGIAHRDLKLDNILLDEAFDILISDFGLSRVVWQPRAGGLIESKTYCGTCIYMAPELLMKKNWKDKKIHEIPYNALYVDVWALGTILFRIYTKTNPFPESDIKKTLENMKNKNYKYPPKCPRSTNLRAIISDMLEYDPLKRPTMAKLTTYFWIRDTYQEVESTNSRLMEGLI